MNTEKEIVDALDAVVQAEIQNDSEFQTSFTALTSDEEKATALAAKRASVLAVKAPEFFAEARKQTKIAADQKIRAEKAEKGEKPPKEGDEKKDLSSSEVLALVGASISHPDDIELIKKSALLLGKDFASTISDPIVSGQLKQQQEFRKTADANNIDPKRPGTKAPTDAEILDRARKGEKFAPGSAEAEQLFWARRGGKKSS